MDISQFFSLSRWENIITANSNPWHIFVSLIDLAIVSFVIYRLIRFVQGTRLMVLVRGVLLFIFCDFIADVLQLKTVEWLLNQVLTYGVIALIIVFQPEIRQALERLGRTTNLLRLNRGKSPVESQIEAYEKSFDYMSKRKIGALIAIERTQTLEEYAASGIQLDADISSALIINIFIPNTPLHDGAVIVQNGKIAVSSAYLPLSEKLEISKEFGTRHRAAIGLSEVSDALVIVVSEETGGISVMLKGRHYANLSKERFHQLLTENLSDQAASGNSTLPSLATFFHKAKSKKGGKS